MNTKSSLTKILNKNKVDVLEKSAQKKIKGGYSGSTVVIIGVIGTYNEQEG